ncbi:thermonuclease family protein [Falsirhodobacter sp. 1013]|uniref:thermonuclease family protein n=1 Tax=Falsirhodobacter sp. 1013 TaxID=3417566 RepID=UPI003EB9EAF4
MARRKKPSRIPGLHVWLLAAALGLAGVIFGRDDPQMRDTFFDMAGRLLKDESTPRETMAGGARIIDGDTLDLDGNRIRLFGIDAPERAQTCRRANHDWNCGTEATAALVRAIGDRKLTCEKRDVDRYDRIVAVCHAGDVELNTWMVRNGWALAYRQYGGEIYGANERAAKADKAGVWSGQFENPWEWRRLH